MTPPLSQDAIAYTWRQLARRAGISPADHSENGSKMLGLPIVYGSPEQVNGPGLIVCRCDDAAWTNLLHAAPNSLHWKTDREVAPVDRQLPFHNLIPVLFWGQEFGAGDKPFVEHRTDGAVIFYADIVAASFFMLSRWEELVLPDLDEHQRFPSYASTAFKQGFLHLPIVDQYALILRSWLQILRPEWKPVKNVFSIKLSHDIDHVRHFNKATDFLIKAAGDVINRRNVKRALQTLKTGISEQIWPVKNPVYQGIMHLAEFSRQHGAASAFYFKASRPGAFDSGYHPGWWWVKEVVKKLQLGGCEIGFHPGYETFDNLDALMAEKRRFENAFHIKCYGGRQHYLKFKVPNTWSHWEQAGLSYDSSMLFSDTNGFRCGTCHPFSPFDVIQNRQLQLTEIPLVVMDVTLKKNGLSPQTAHDEIRNLAERCFEVEGTFTMLWHNTSLYDEWMPWYEMYEVLIPELIAMQKRDHVDE